MNKEKTQKHTIYQILPIALLLLSAPLTLYAYTITNNMLIPIITFASLAKLATYTNKKLNMTPPQASTIPKIQKTTPYKIASMALATQWSQLFIAISIILLPFTSTAIRCQLDPPKTLHEMKKSSGNIEDIKEGRTGPRSSNKDYITIETNNGNILELHSIFNHKELKELRSAKENNQVITFWYQENGPLFKGRIWEISNANKIIQEYNEPLVRKRYKQNTKILKLLITYLLLTYTLIPIYFYIKIKNHTGD